MNDIDKVQSVQTQGVNKSRFNGSFTHKHTQKIADVVPNACVPVFPGDSFDGKVATAFNFPPLVSPAYQGFTQKSYMFRVRKGLLWHNDGIRNTMNCLKTGESLQHPEPHIPLSSEYYFGSNKYCIRFHPHIPVYGHRQWKLNLLHKHDNLSDGSNLRQSYNGIGELSVNAFLQNHMDAFIDQDFFNKENCRNMFSGFIANKDSHGVDSKNPLYFAGTPEFFSHCMTQKGDSVGSRFGFKAITNHWNATGDGVISNGNKSVVNTDSEGKTAMILTFYPFSENVPTCFEDPSVPINSVLFADYESFPDDELNPKGLTSFACAYVQDGVGGPSSLMEYLGLPSFNTTPYVDELRKRLVVPFADLVSISTSKLCYDVKKTMDAILSDPDLGTSNYPISEANDDFNSVFVSALDEASQNTLVAWDVQGMEYSHEALQGSKYVEVNYPFFNSHLQGYDPAPIGDNTVWKHATMYDFMQIYALWCIENGYGDGTIPNDEDCPVIYVRNMSNVFVAPRVDSSKSLSSSVNYPCQSLCPWLAYWSVYENFFRDSNISPSLKPVLDIFKTANVTLNLESARSTISKYDSTDYVTWFGKDFSDYSTRSTAMAALYNNMLFALYGQLLNSPSTVVMSGDQPYNPLTLINGTPDYSTSYLANIKKYRFRTECYKELMYPFRKLLDKDLFTSILPTTSKVEVFAPSFSSSDLATLYDGKKMFVGLDEELANGSGATSAQPFSLSDSSLPNISSYIDVDALRTAKILQSYYRDASLVGDQINQFILLTYGERSQDFRPEIPELVFAREFPCHISEITQQSETSELPLGSEGGKMSSSSSSISFHIDSHGDFAYFIYLTCIYPETENNNGLNHQFDVFANQFEQLFVPRFATLGEEGLTSLQVDCLPKAKFKYDGSNAITADDSVEDSSRVVGYVPRYALFKRLPSYISGRFKGDMNSWTLDRLPNPFEDRMKLSHQYLSTPRDLRLFASDEEENCYGFTAFNMSFVRGVASNDYQPVL